MKLIPLTHGFSAKIDDEDSERINKWKWRVTKAKHANYAVRSSPKIKRNGVTFQTTISMAREIMGVTSKVTVDHIDFDGLNNQKSNLRVCSYSENNYHARMRPHNTSGFKGVCWNKGKLKWQVSFRTNGRAKFYGYFSDKNEAAKHCKRMMEKAHGEFAHFDFKLPEPSSHHTLSPPCQTKIADAA